jgi:hypothetical protein
VFGRCFVISLERTPERLKAFWDRFPTDWPYACPEVFTAIDGREAVKPPGWRVGNPSVLGCYLSWLSLVELAIAERWDVPFLAMEDDCQFSSTYAAGMATVLANAPGDWDILYFGGQHDGRRGKPKTMAPGVVRVLGAWRTHCLAVHPRFVAPLRDFLRGWHTHIDSGLWSIAPRHRFYAADPFVAVQGANHSTITDRYEPPRGWGADMRGCTTYSAEFSHAGDVGDLIAALPALRVSSEPFGGGRLVCWPARWTRQRMSPDVVASLRPLLDCQPYIKSVEFADFPVGVALDAWRRQRWPKIYSLADRALDLVGAAHAERDRPWLVVEPNRVARVVFARSPRYHNPRFPWRRVVERYGREAVFVGFPDEHAAFVREFGDVPYFPTKDYLELARVLAGSELVVVNQTSTFWVAMGLGCRIVQEQDAGGNWNCHHQLDRITHVLHGNEALPNL